MIICDDITEMVLHAHVDISVMFKIAYDMSHYLDKHTRHHLDFACFIGNGSKL